MDYGHVQQGQISKGSSGVKEAGLHLRDILEKAILEGKDETRRDWWLREAGGGKRS